MEKLTKEQLEQVKQLEFERLCPKNAGPIRRRILRWFISYQVNFRFK